jgi:hypothetical protein
MTCVLLMFQVMKWLYIPFNKKRKKKKIMLGLARLSDKLTELGINPQSILNDILAVTTYANKFLPPKINNFFFLFRSSLN